MNTYFVTGATGVVGSAVCEQLLGMPDARLIILARADDDEHLERRIEALARYWAMPRVA